MLLKLVIAGIVSAELGGAATVPVGFAQQPDAPARIVIASCDSSSGSPVQPQETSTTVALDESGAMLQIGVLPKQHSRILSVRIGRVHLLEPNGSVRDASKLVVPAKTTACGALLSDVHVVRPKGKFSVGMVWLYLGEVRFADGTRWSVGSPEQEAEFQKLLANSRLQ